MTDFAVVFAPGAEDDITHAFGWYRERNALAADAFRSSVFAAIDRIVAAPLNRPEDEDGNRKFVLRRFPYSVHDEVCNRTVTVLAVAHHRRRPGYWRAQP